MRPKREPLPIADRGLVVKFTTIALWSVLFAVFLPAAYQGVLGALLATLLVGTTVVGAVLAVTGLLRHDNLVTEVAGLYAMLAAPIGYVVLVIAVGILGLAQGDTDRIALIALAALQVEVIGTRLLFLVQRRRAVQHDNMPGAKS